MRFDVVQKSIIEVECDVLVVNLFEGVKSPGGATGAVDRATGGAVSALIERESFEGKLGQIADMTPVSGVAASRVFVVGLGKREEFDADKIRRASSAVVRRARDLSAKKVATILHGGGIGGIDPTVASRALVQGTILGAYQFTRLKTSDVKPLSIDEFDIVELDEGKIEAIRSGLERGRIAAEATCFVRDLVNEPANVVTPTYLAALAGKIAEEAGFDCQVMGRTQIEAAGMNLLLAVANGSVEEPKFIRMDYRGGGKTVAIIGKGITFDSGGLNLKPGESMKSMKDDMGGAACVLAAMRAIGEIKPNINVMALIPTTENMIGGSATRVGDVIRALSGKTVEIDNTDAEGRLVLADAAAYAEHENVDEIIDIATLTGACVVALGRGMAGVLGSDQSIVDGLIAAGQEDGEKLWQLPLHLDYRDHLKSEVADMKNAGGREGGAIIGAIFIKNHFDKPWAHIDIAGPVTIESATDLSTKGGTGFGAATLINYLLAK